MKREAFALTVVLAFVLLFPASVLGYQALRSQSAGVRTIEIVARAPADGGWQPDALRLTRGERVRLRIAAADVVHSFAVPALGIDVEEIQPGHVAEVEFVADRAGRFPFACTRWCSPDHWRMRGIIEVAEPEKQSPRATVARPLYQQLLIDLDALRPPAPAPSNRPSASRGALLGTPLPRALEDAGWLRSHSPEQAFALLKEEVAAGRLDDTDLWALVALAWRQEASAGELAKGESLFRRDCAACHGESGRGDGPAGRKVLGKSYLRPGAKTGPADLTDVGQMLSASDALLQGKVLRGGMGTGMPEWGSLYDDEDLWAVVSYLRTFVFDYAE